MSFPIIAIIGRPNVGKSTLFNRIVGERYAITSKVAGTTRDRIYHEAELGGYDCILVDTGGMDFEKKESIEADIQAQARIAVEDADLIFFVVDPTEPLTANDLDCAELLRRSKKPAIIVANKADNQKSLENIHELYTLGFGEPICVSAIHNTGIPELDEKVGKTLKKMKWEKEKRKKTDEVSIAIVGKPNVGKSSLVNALIGERRLIVSPIAGTTIDTTDTPLSLHGQKFVLIDTAGLRRRGKVGMGLERFGVLRALAAISRANVVVLVLDFDTGLANQDLHVSNFILDSGKGLIIAVNKTDLMEDAQEEQGKFLDLLTRRMNYVPWAPVLFISAFKRKNIFKILDIAKSIYEERIKKIPEATFKIFLEATIYSHPLTRNGVQILIEKAWQSGVAPPTFTFICPRKDMIHFSYKRFIENEIRRKFGFQGTAIKLVFKERE